MKTSLLLTLGLAALLLTAPAVSADVIRLKNGDTFTGQILSRADGKVTFKGNLYGEIVFNEADIDTYKVGPATTIADLDATPVAAPAAAAPIAAAPATPAAPGGASTFQGQADAPHKPVWARSITFGGNYMSATFNQGPIPGTPPGTTGASLGLPGQILAVTGNATFMRSTETNVHALELKYAYTDYEPAGTQTDNYSATYFWNRKINERFYTVSRTSYSVDQVKNIDYSAIQLFGLGYKFVNTPQTKLDLVPGIVLLQEKKGNRFDDKFVYGGGFLENYVHHFNPYASFEQRFLYRQSFEESEIYAIDAYIGFKGMVTPKLGLTVGLLYLYDNTLGPVTFPFGGTTITLQAQKKDQLTLTSGFEYKF